MGTVMISIVVPTFRRPAMVAAHLAEALAQARAAPAGTAEIIVVDNCPERSAAAAVAALGDHATLRYLHIDTPGVVHARNAGVAAAQGEWILFLDDDELPCPGWLDAFRAAAEAGVDLGFGAIEPRYAAPPPPSRRALLDRLYARALAAPPLGDITAQWARLGTGNGLFRRALLDGETTFDPRFNRTGGEDMNLIRRLMARGARLRWVPDGLVREIVPADRMSAEYLARRRFAQGQIRCLLIAAEGGSAALPRLALWMGIGALQAAGYGVAAAAARLAGRDADPWRARMLGGLGKLRWRDRASGLDYGGA